MSNKFWEEIETKLKEQHCTRDEDYVRTLKTLMKAEVTSIGDLITIIQDTQMPIQTRACACWMIGRLRYKRAAKILLETIVEKNKLLIWESAKALRSLGSKKSTPGLIFLLRNASVDEHRIAAAYALAQTQDPIVVEALIETLGNKSEPPRLRGQAAEALAYLRASSSFDVLFASLKDPAVEVRFWSVFALGELRDKRAVIELNRIAVQDPGILPGWGTLKKEAEEAIMKIDRGVF